MSSKLFVRQPLHLFALVFVDTHSHPLPVMFFRRVFARNSNKSSDNGPDSTTEAMSDDSSTVSSRRKPKHPPVNHATTDAQPPSSSSSRPHSVLQLTPLWEHIIRTRSLPAHLSSADLFGEFADRLRDPEWQVRQHALRVLVDVLAVLNGGGAADPDRDAHEFEVLVRPLVENLGHAAPAIRRGALNVLRAYMRHARRPHDVLGEAIRIGMQRQPPGDAAGGAVASRLCAGVMLALPALVQTQRGRQRAGARRILAQMAVRALAERMAEITYQVCGLDVCHTSVHILHLSPFCVHRRW